MAEQLTEDIWTLIMVHVPPADRLGRCALVSQRLRKAAAAATDALELAFTQGHEQRAEAFQGYLQQHGRHLTKLKLQCSDDQLFAQLPCSRLLCLELRDGAVQLGPHNGLPGVLASCTGLTRLDLSLFQVPRALSGLSVLVDLRDLQLVGVYSHGLATLPGSVFACTQHLTRLHLSTVFVDALHHVSCLSSLAVLSICEPPSRLRLARDIAPGFVLPASLHDLSLTGSRVELGPAVLSAVTQLTRLELRYFSLLGQGTSGGAALLAAVAGLHRLATLKLGGLTLVWPPPSAAYHALTASSRLQKLLVSGCFLPAGAWVHVFPPAAVCDELRWLEITDAVSVEDVSALVRCCPRLHVLSGPAVAALKPLTCLTSLHLYANSVSGAGVADCMPGIAALTSLCSLRLSLMVNHQALLPLTALTALTSCELYARKLTNQAGPGQPPDVWQQLQQWCLA